VHKWVDIKKDSNECLLKIQSHNPDDLCIWAKKAASSLRDSPSPRQQNGLKRFRSGNFGDPERRSWASDTDLVGAFLKIFDDLFFFGSLTQMTTVQIGAQQPGIGWGGTEYGEYPSTRGTTKIKAHITLHLLPYASPDRKEQVRIILSVLLHEMIHVYVDAYSCPYTGCSSRSGVRGHGQSWQQVAQHLEISTEKNLRLKLDLDRALMLASEIIFSGRSMSPREIEELDLDPNEVRRLVNNNRNRLPN
jgi:hypothetical protein